MAENRDSALSLAFMQGHPAQAARVLEALPAPDAAAVFERAPVRLCAGVLAAMLARPAANCIAALGDARSLELLVPMSTQSVVAILRHLPEPRRRTLLAGLPTASLVASTLLLGYTEDTLGAWADPDVFSLSADTSVANALEGIRQTRSEHATLFVTDATRRLVGLVGLAALMQAPGAATLATLMRRPVAVLAAQAPLAGVAGHPGWVHASLLPVVESGERLVGAMTRDALTRALERHAQAPDARPAVASLPGLLAGGYWQALSGLMESGLALLPRVPPMTGDADAA